MTRRRLAGLLLFLAAVFVPASATTAEASCAAPILDLPPNQVLETGDDITVTGRHFLDGCRDHGSCSGYFGCQRCDYGPEPQALEDLTLVLVQGGQTWELDTADAGAKGEGRGRVTWTFDLPDGAQPGPASLVVDDRTAEPTSVRIR